MRLLLKTNKSPQSRVRRNRVVMQCLALIGAWLVATSSASAQTTDLTLHDSQGGGAVPGIGNVFTLDEALGIRPGAGMDRFHLFEKFNLGAGDTVEWTASLPTRSIFNLISGSDPSQINGTLRSTLSTDIYLINPAGVIFNESASLNLAGSFFASTADALEFSNGASLEIPGVDQAQILALGAIDFESFGFLDSNESIEINGASLSVGNDAVLSFASARSVRVEGTAGITEAQLAAGRVNLSAERGGVRFENARVTSTAGSPSGGSGIFAIAEKDIELNPDTILRAQGPGNSLGIGLSGRNISIRGTNTRVLSTNGAGDGGSIEFVANHLLSVTDGAQVRAEATGTGRAADIEFIAENVLMVEGEVLTSSDSAANSQGRIDMEVEEVVNLQQSRIASNLPNSGSGVIHVAAALVVLQDESSIVADPVLGHIEITADLIIRSTESEIRADTVALSGTEMVRSLHTDLNERLEVLPQSFFENRARLDPHCALGSGDATGSLVVEKRRAFPDSPEQLRVPSYDSITTQARLASAATKSTPWAILLATFRSLPEPSGADWLVLASRAEAAGLLSSAQAAADAGIEQAAVSPQPPQTEIALRTLRGRIQARTQDHTQAAADLDYAMNLANRIGDDNLLAKVYLDYAVAKARNGNGVGALQALAKAREHATRGGDGELIRIIDADHQSIALEFPTTQSTPPPLQSVRHGEIENTGAMAAEMHQVLATLRSPNALAAAAKAKQAAADRLVELTSLSETLGFESLASYGWGFLAQLYAEQGRHDDALTLTDWAIASVLGLTEGPLHRWQAQRADLLNRRGDYTAAAQSYAMALKAANRLGYAAILEKVPRGPLPSDTLPGEPLIGPYIDVLLRLADKAPNETARQEQLAVVRNLIEEQRVQELKDYFQDPCIAAQETRSAETLPRTLVLHPIVLADRLVVLASSASGISTHTIPIAR
ncbi:MAG: filamentous hemagglutinin family protein, partial [Myxococcota bacterium]